MPKIFLVYVIQLKFFLFLYWGEGGGDIKKLINYLFIVLRTNCTTFNSQIQRNFYLTVIKEKSFVETYVSYFYIREYSILIAQFSNLNFAGFPFDTKTPERKSILRMRFARRDRIAGKLRAFARSAQTPSFAERGIELSVCTPR